LQDGSSWRRSRASSRLGCPRVRPDTATAAEVAGYFSILSDVFLRLIKMIIAPLVFATVVAGITGMGDAKAVGRIGAKALLWFISASLVSLLLGCSLRNSVPIHWG
jgi:Na+/H+-dicarboxylate symporter